MSDAPPSGFTPYRWLMIVLALVILVAGYNRISSLHAPVPPEKALPKIATIPPFALTERSGRTVTNRDLAGKIWVADFIYTTCPGPCPIVTAGMARIQEAVKSDPQVMLVSFTVDPNSDTPPVLAAYANKFGADPNRWWFVTGSEKPLFNLIQNGFLQWVQDNSGHPLVDGEFKVTHSTRLSLVDGNGVLRGIYDGLDVGERANLLRDIQKLEKEEAQ
jgi:protein SCO1/2